MKITEYPSVKQITADNVTLIDGNNGTKQILASDLVLGSLHLNSAYNHRAIFRGKNLGAIVTEAQKTSIQLGTFDDIWLGDYWEIGGVKWRIVDIDYWYNAGSPNLTDHHVVIMPDTALYTAAMNASSTTSGGYVSSQMYTTNLATAKSRITSAFGDLVMSHREFLINAVTSGYPSAGTWYDSTVDLPNEIMMFGCHIYTPANNGTTDVKRYTSSNTQLSLFRIVPEFINTASFWLRDIASATHFIRIDGYRGVNGAGAANTFGVRPVFAVG